MTMPEILVQSPDGSRQTVPLTTERVSIGRSRESDIYLPGEWLSRRHAEIQRRADGFYLVDLKSKNGTQLNGARIAEQRLAEGDEIVLGEHHLTFIDDAPIAEESDVMPPGTLVFSTNLRRFKLDEEALADLSPEDITARTIPRDFARNPRIHSCWLIRAGGGAAQPPAGPQPSRRARTMIDPYRSKKA